MTVLDLNFQTGDLRVYWSGNHTHAVADEAVSGRYDRASKASSALRT